MAERGASCEWRGTLPQAVPTAQEIIGVAMDAIDEAILQLHHAKQDLKLQLRELAPAPEPGAMVRLAEDEP